jgi:hypothetical protein
MRRARVIAVALWALGSAKALVPSEEFVGPLPV